MKYIRIIDLDTTAAEYAHVVELSPGLAPGLHEIKGKHYLISEPNSPQPKQERIELINRAHELLDQAEVLILKMIQNAKRFQRQKAQQSAGFTD